MHVLFGLNTQGFDFELKGGTSLSKGFKIIERFSEDIDIHIKPPIELNVTENPNNVHIPGSRRQHVLINLRLELIDVKRLADKSVAMGISLDFPLAPVC
ncbi:nucleotidyl transferase AbiEii/AbiGii toxin family protein [Mucilaginibacter sp. 22184]|uniref:nucleotidyl transferase AbiEii/AbiGii toxin family protein n=1 Tax=Mucilaginibacter sp. 22184 TaxID=3453887 RepID=UPI003F879C95